MNYSAILTINGSDRIEKESIRFWDILGLSKLPSEIIIVVYNGINTQVTKELQLFYKHYENLIIFETIWEKTKCGAERVGEKYCSNKMIRKF